ncbi:MAG: division/cell wall cluster transcriptional repressor MraZ [Ignavibacteriales bacterium]
MFLGSFKYSLDSKFRVSIPATMRKFLKPEANDTFVMTRGTTKCIIVYPMDHWKELVASRLNKLNAFDPQDAMFLRMFLQEAAEDKLDSQSRLTIPKKLIEFADIKKDVLILGVNQFIEFWNPDNYDTYLKENNKPYDEIAKEVMKI